MKYVRKAESRKIRLDHLKMGLGIIHGKTISLDKCKYYLHINSAIQKLIKRTKREVNSSTKAQF